LAWAICLTLLALAPASLANDECGKVASVQNEVETRASAKGSWAASTLGEILYSRDRVRTGEASRAAILYSDQTLHRINEKSEVEVMPPEAGSPGMLRVLSGKHYFSSRKPKDYGRVETPTVTAAIRGTEFAVIVDPDGTTTIVMIEGVVSASNSFGSLEVVAGEAAYVEPGKAPVRQVVVRPRDAVTWSLYYPPVLGGKDAERLESMGEEGRRLAHAAELLSAGQVGQATPLIEQAMESTRGNPVALALAAVIAVVQDRKTEALDLAQRAFNADDQSTAAALSLSLAAQASFDIPRAREMAELAVRLDPESSEAQARVAELRMAEGDTRGAKRAAESAVRRDPDSSRALAVLGFVELAELRTKRALATFESAVAADPGFPLARLGLGIARLRNDLSAGREDIQTAVILDPDNSLFRSYLSKAYYEERRQYEASKELAIAKELDPSDPTPYLYDAILKQTYNRPVEALKDLQQSIDLNDNRAVYRSRLLLDEDLAVRSADLAGIYNDLGFDQLGMVTARRTADSDQSNYSSHLFLAGTYRGLPGFAPAFLSETLQARIYQPVNVNAVRPDVVNETVSFNEYTALFNRPRVRGFAGVTYGSTDTDLSDYFEPGQTCITPEGEVGPCEEILEVDSSNPRGGDATFTFNRDRVAGAVSYETFRTEGFRVNNDIESDALRAFFAFAPTNRDQIQLNYISGSRDTGDLPLRGFPGLIGLERIKTDLTNIGVGYHRIISPAADLAISAIYSDTEQQFDVPLFTSTNAGTFKGPQLEAQYVLRKKRTTWTAGAGHFDGEQTNTTFVPGIGETRASGDDTFSNAYVYAKLRNLGPVEITAGAAYEDALVPVGLLPPRDSTILPGDVLFEDSQVSPKFGLSAQASSKTVVRATAYSRLAPAIGRLQTLEPTQVVGFNQFFDDPGGTSSFNYGVGLDQIFTKSFFAGFSLLRRDLEIPEPTCATPDPVFGCVFQPATDVVQRTSDDWLGNIYLNGTAGKRVALSLEYAYEERDFDFTSISNNSLFEDYVETQRTRPEVRFFLPMGFFTRVRATFYDQKVDQFDDLSSPDRSTIESDFWIGDLEIGYRLPKRWGTVSLTVLNFNDHAYEFYRSSLEEEIVPARTALFTVSFLSP
jgi:Tfp pilus assembly protein PilF